MVQQSSGYRCCSCASKFGCRPSSNLVRSNSLNHSTFAHTIHSDIDLHHGQGTQEIAWRINQAAHQAGTASPLKGTSPAKSTSPTRAAQKRKRPLEILYASLHDVLSYPCEDGDPRMVADASVRLSGAHGQFISNTHLVRFFTLLWR